MRTTDYGEEDSSKPLSTAFPFKSNFPYGKFTYGVNRQYVLGISLLAFKQKMLFHDTNLWLKMSAHSSGLHTLWSCKPLSASFSSFSHPAEQSHLVLKHSVSFFLRILKKLNLQNCKCLLLLLSFCFVCWLIIFKPYDECSSIT